MTSNLWTAARAADAVSLGSFAIQRRAPAFSPWDGDAEQPANDVAAPPTPDLAPVEADAFADGFEQGRRTVELELAAEREALARLAESLEALRPEPPAPLALVLAETVERLVRQIVGEVEIDPTTLLTRARAAAALVAEEVEPARLCLHPDDIPLLGEANLPLPIAPDPSLDRGALRVESGAGWIEDGPAVRLDRLRTRLDKLGASA